MKKFILCSVVLFLCFQGCKKKSHVKERMCSRVDLERIVELFPKTSHHVQEVVVKSKKLMDDVIDQVQGIDKEQRTHQNTVLLYEKAYFQFLVNLYVFKVLASFSDDVTLQKSAHDAVVELEHYQNKVVKNNKILLQAFQEYSEHGTDSYKKSISVQSFLKNMIEKFKSIGLSSSDQTYKEIKKLEQEIADALKRCNEHLNSSYYHAIIAAKDLKGVPDSFLRTLPKWNGDYCVLCNKQAYEIIMTHCAVEATRKTCYMLYVQAGYTQNEILFKDLLDKRYEFAQLLGYPNYASYQLHDLMIKTPKHAESFLLSTLHNVYKNVDREFEAMKQAGLAPSVTLVNGTLLKPWDIAYVQNYYKQKHFDCKVEDLKEFFVLSRVLSGTFDLFNKFFHIEIEKQETDSLWSKDVECYRIRSLKHQSILGYLFLDLYDRKSKKNVDSLCETSSIGYMPIIPAIRDECSLSCVVSVLLYAHFAKVAGASTYLSMQEVIGLIHQLGHVMHELFGATKFAQFSGTQVVKDFMEIPSYMLESWLCTPEFLKTISTDVATGKSLSDAQIKSLIGSQQFGKAFGLQHEIFLSLMALRLHVGGVDDIKKEIEPLFKQTMHHVTYEPHCCVGNYFRDLFTQCPVAYYRHIWSQIIGANLFDTIQHRGIFNYETGNDYVTEILSSGGLRSPYEMIGRFLGKPFYNPVFLSN